MDWSMVVRRDRLKCKQKSPCTCSMVISTSFDKWVIPKIKWFLSHAITKGCEYVKHWLFFQPLHSPSILKNVSLQIEIFPTILHIVEMREIKCMLTLWKNPLAKQNL